MKFKLAQVAVILLILGGIAFLTTSCTGNSTSGLSTEAQTYVVQKGSISISVTGTGNLVLKDKNNLSFGQTGLVNNQKTAKVTKVNVVEGQMVEKDQILVAADTKDWQDEITLDQHNLDLKKSILLSAQTSLESAQYELNAQEDVKDIQDKIDNTNIKLQQAELMYQESSHYGDRDGVSYWINQISYLDNQTLRYKSDLTELLADPVHYKAATSGTLSSIAEIQTKIRAVDNAKAQVVNAQNDLDDAQTALDDAKNSAQVIKAPYKGLITKVDVSEGDIVVRSTNLVEIAQPENFEAIVVVTERDVNYLTIGKGSVVTFDALPGLSFPAKITRIAPKGAIQQGVVTYQVTVELTSIEPVKDPSANTSSITLKEGFSAVATIPVQEKNNILVVPSKAISHQGQNYVVQVQTGTTPETRIVKTGITDYQNTEIIDGLSLGEKVVLPVIPTTTSSSSGMFGGPGG
jgi:RND family efflux transporter MFP subunit